MSMNLNELPALVERLQKLDRSLDLDAIKTAVLGVEAAMADMMEKLGPELSKSLSEAIVKGLSSAKFGGGASEAPTVNVTVPKFDIPAPVINNAGGPRQLVIVPERGVNGMAKSYTVTIK